MAVKRGWSGRVFEDFEVGKTYRTPRRTVTQSDIVNFASLSGDFNAPHVDWEFCKEQPYGEPIAHGLLVLAIAGGLMCQWAHTYDISDADLRSIVATFSSVFAHSTLWIVGDGDVLLVGSAEPIEPRLPAIGRNWSRASVAEDLLDVAHGTGDRPDYSCLAGGGAFVSTPTDLVRLGKKDPNAFGPQAQFRWRREL